MWVPAEYAGDDMKQQVKFYYVAVPSQLIPPSYVYSYIYVTGFEKSHLPRTIINI